MANKPSRIIEKQFKAVKDDQQLEHLLFLRIYSMDLDDARSGVIEAERASSEGVKFRLIRDIAVTYARAFSGNRGDAISKHRCSLDVVPEQFREIHEKLITLRDQRFAHSDLSHYKPRLGRWKTDTGFTYPMSFKGVYAEELNQQLPEIKKLLNAVAQNLNSEIIRLQKELDKVEAS